MNKRIPIVLKIPSLYYAEQHTIEFQYSRPGWNGEARVLAAVTYFLIAEAAAEVVSKKKKKISRINICYSFLYSTYFIYVKTNIFKRYVYLFFLGYTYLWAM